MDNFTTNIKLSAEDIALTVTHIHIPEGMALLGVMPILAILFGTDSVHNITKRISALSSKHKDLLASKVEKTILTQKYPIEKSVWQFNDPANDISALSHALKDPSPLPMSEFLQFLSLYSDTFPFIHTYFEEIDPRSILEVSEDYEFRQQPISARSNPSQSKEVSPSALIVPSVAIGSLMLLSSKLKNTQGNKV